MTTTSSPNMGWIARRRSQVSFMDFTNIFEISSRHKNTTFPSPSHHCCEYDPRSRLQHLLTRIICFGRFIISNRLIRQMVLSCASLRHSDCTLRFSLPTSFSDSSIILGQEDHNLTKEKHGPRRWLPLARKQASVHGEPASICGDNPQSLLQKIAGEEIKKYWRSGTCRPGKPSGPWKWPGLGENLV